MTNNEKSIHARIKWLLIAGGVLVAIGAGLLVWVPYQRQMRLIEEIEATGGNVFTKPDGPDWLRELVGNERMRGFDAIHQVSLKAVPSGNAWAKRLGHLSNLRRLRLDSTLVSDDGLEHLPVLTSLQELSLGGARISDNGLKHLAGLAHLTNLSLRSSKISDDGLKHLAGLPSLKRLSLNNTQISDEGLESLSGLISLQFLHLEHTQVSDDGVKHLSGLSNLNGLFLKGTQISDAAVKQMRQALPDCRIFK